MTRLVVSDTGPGIPAAKREQMNAGFTRMDSCGEGLGFDAEAKAIVFDALTQPDAQVTV